ncbi:DUF6415 family natural product biosynthesis protein [Streptomyces sp. TRM70350]|uniref:DUF6415 family natural product biosynthesis protein n=1 Tax=Streptomyces sp. TRM70350 TaxID=2856165 RepID=UPI001C45AC9B|nr:DUF6415 family natural product biosynthesis protein [Streptomyces sp. TRM70350]MBV7697726.1 hypothetical protein [Streptomyces sp. TRM70350]
MTVNPSLPIDIQTMRATAHRLLADDAEPPSHEELEALTLQLRGHLMLAVPEVETATLAAPADAGIRVAASACIGEARHLLGVEPGRSLPAGIAHAQGLARSVHALCRHYEAFNSGPVTGDHWSPAQLAFRRWAIHGTRCRVCRTDDSHCERGRRLGDHWNHLRRNPTAAGTPAPA